MRPLIAARAPPRSTTPASSRNQAPFTPCVVPRKAAAGVSAARRRAWKRTVATKAAATHTRALARRTRMRRGSHVSSVVTVPACHSAPMNDAESTHANRTMGTVVPLNTSTRRVRRKRGSRNSGGLIVRQNCSRD